MSTPPAPASIAAIELIDPESGPTTLSAFAADPLVVILVRYFGCLPCQEFLRDVDRTVDRFPGGSRVIAIGGSADYQARWLRDIKKVRMPLLLDAEQRTRAVVSLGDLTATEMVGLGGARNYVRSIVHGFRPQIPTSDATKAPGIVIFDRNFNVTWVHRGHALGDYPPVDDLITRVEALAERS